MLTREAIELFKDFMRKAKWIKYTGRVANANRLARVLPLYQGFVMTNLEWFKEKMFYEQVRRRRPGPLAHIYPFFRDKVVLQALRELAAEQLEVSVEKVPAMRFFYKKQRRRDGRAAPRSIVGWERV